jgi:hypothetical protein
MSHSFGFGTSAVSAYDSHSSTTASSLIEIDINDTSDSNQLVYVSGTFVMSTDAQGALGFKLKNSSGTDINTSSSGFTSGTTSSYPRTNWSNVYTGYWAAGNTPYSNSALRGEMTDIQMYIDMYRSSDGTVKTSGQYTSIYRNNSGYFVSGRGAFRSDSNDIPTSVCFYKIGTDPNLVGSVRSQVILGKY